MSTTPDEPPAPPPANRGSLVSLAAVTWDFALVGRTRMLTEAWRRIGVPTAFVQVPYLRTGWQRLRRGPRDSGPVPVVRPWPLPPPGWWRRLGEARLRRFIRRLARGLREELAPLVDWRTATAIVITPVWAPWLEELPFARVIYDCIDTVRVHVPRPGLGPWFRRWEDELLRQATGVVVTAEILAGALGARRAGLPTRTIPNGVDAAWFVEQARGSPRPPDLPERGRPIVGFVGALYEWIDWGLIAEVTAAMPECDFVFVGPFDRRRAAPALPRRDNVRFLGRRPYALVPAYVAAFDVGWVPFDASDVSKAANPVKIYEYLALGKPVVTTPVADVQHLGSLVRVGSGPGSIREHLRAALNERDEAGARSARVAFAQANTWEARAREYLDFLDALGC